METNPAMTTSGMTTHLNGRARKTPGKLLEWSPNGQPFSLSDGAQENETSTAADPTPMLAFSGPKGQLQPIVADADYGPVQTAIKQVS